MEIRRHIVTILLLVIAVVAFTMRFFMEERWQNYCDIASFVLPTVAALVKIVISEKSGKVLEKKIQKLKDNQLSVRAEGNHLVFEKGVE